MVGSAAILRRGVGAPCQTKNYRTHTRFQSDWDVQEGGVAIMASHPYQVFGGPDLVPDDVKVLYETTRFTHGAIPYDDGQTAFHILNYYGVSGNASDAVKRTQN